MSTDHRPMASERERIEDMGGFISDMSVPRVNGILAISRYVWLWLCGCVVVWLCGCVVVWLCGCVVVWLCGCVVVWLCDCISMGFLTLFFTLLS